MGARPAAVVAALACVALGGYLAMRMYERANTGPFTLGVVRAGMSFATLDDREHELTKRRFVCMPIQQAGKLCQLHSMNPKSMVRIFVDADGRAAIIQVWPAEESSPIKDDTRRHSAEWSTVRPPVTARPDGGRPWESTTLWRSADRRWSALIQMSCFPTAPPGIEVADDRAIAKAIASGPTVRDELVAASLIAPPDEVESSEAPRRSPGECVTPTFASPTQ